MSCVSEHDPRHWSVNLSPPERAKDVAPAGPASGADGAADSLGSLPRRADLVPTVGRPEAGSPERAGSVVPPAPERAPRQVAPKIAADSLFVTKLKQAMGARSVENIVTKHLTEAGIHGASVHSLWHTFATQHVRRGSSLNSIRQALGHESLAITRLAMSSLSAI